MDYSVASVSPALIDTADHTFKLTTQTESSDLARSIDAIGILHPPLLIQKGKTFLVVSGFRRLAACEALAMPAIPARVVPSDLPQIDCARFAIADNAFQRPLNLVEQSRGFALLRRYAGSPSEALQMAASVGLPDSRAALDRLLPIAEMSESMQTAIVEGSIALAVALEISQHNADDAIALSDFFRRINAGLNVQRELLTWIGEISIRDGLSVVDLLGQNDIAAIMAHRQSSAPQKVRQLRRLLRSWRYPEISSAEEAYRQTVKSLRLPSSIQIQPPQFFEGRSYRLTLSVNSRRQLRSLLPEIEKVADHPDALPTV
jgi:ParB family chromosome partitioning protein